MQASAWQSSLNKEIFEGEFKMTYEKVKEIIVEQLGLDESEIKKETSFEDLGLDSLDIVELLMAIEEEFEIEVKAEDAGKTVSDLVKYIEDNK